MTRYLRLSCCLVLLCSFFSLSTSARTAPPVSNTELIISVPLLNEKDFSNVKSLLEHTNGLVLEGYCGQYKCFLMTYDPTRIKSGQVVADMIEAAYPYKTEIKTGATIAQLIDSCTKYALPATGTAR